MTQIPSSKSTTPTFLPTNVTQKHVSNDVTTITTPIITNGTTATRAGIITSVTKSTFALNTTLHPKTSVPWVNSTNTSLNSTEPNKSSLSPGQKSNAGVVVGIVFGVILLLAFAIFIIKKRSSVRKLITVVIGKKRASDYDTLIEGPQGQYEL